ncbi:iron-sulfur cluster assembly scaffold protein [Erythrobacter sp. R86502]|uniref:iron-sulfur cluster assembly scaffold protein n=1 Tax=Erythrobacter sp. R86502 TaxID=3093846 RepID=UPI0036D3F225
MPARPVVRLYSPEVLGLATDLAHYPLDDALPLQAEARSRSCGSVMTLGLALGEDGGVAAIGMTVSACAIGQASASLFARSAIGTDPSKIIDTAATVERWVSGEGALPDWPQLDLLAPALAHPGRHGAVLLPWKAACAALSPRGVSR